MKKLAKNILTILIFSLVISGCAKPPPEPRLKITKVELHKACPAPTRPVYGEFNNELHAGHLGNLEMMTSNLEKALRYNDSLENTLGCYRHQSEKFNVQN
jgi:hypothetical protein